MNTTDPVELLERAIGYARGALGAAATADPDSPTPCSEWRLGALLAHMSDSLDAFTEASSGLISIRPPSGDDPTPVGVLYDQACTLLGAWTSPAARTVRLGDRRLASGILLSAGALEIAVHAWDVARATRFDAPLPEGLATDLLPAAYALVDAADRGVRFAEALPVPDAAPASVRLLAFLGRSCPETGVSGGPLRSGQRTPFG
ncbi:TIGR03086 family metal-binding protein [Nocardioides sp. Root140]|uniref:TIGR03086 family metal-binding protein n=1 Tax=Nocardioides sp. Root140 TaxID=1736460 RepID=UPI0006F1D0F8|nr:TIGR03086 family metal-binding protein [Nocardioides sp. Root140]KQY57579.1 hypothetical protein ASD30_15520 [Nocardioides sp. Root140]